MCSVRLDIYVKDKMNISRQKAQELIESSAVSVNGMPALKPSLKIGENDSVSIGNTQSVLKYVGRGGYKLEKACDVFGLELKGRKCIDIGASTGGFTDCMLQRGAESVCCVDVGSNQLAEKIRKDSRVRALENTDIRNADIERADFISCDVSFISLSMILSHIKRLLNEDGCAVVLIKPQFEAGRENINKNGIVKNPNVHKKVICDIIACAQEEGLFTRAVAYSPIRGGDGNREYLALLSQEGASVSKFEVDRVVKEAFDKL